MKTRSQNFRFEQNVFKVPFGHPKCKKNPKRFESLVIRAMRIGFNAKEGQYETLGKTCHY